MNPAPPTHTTAAILSTGDEIVTGQLQDTNARWLSQQLLDAGILPIAHAAVGDSLPDLVSALRHAARQAPLIIMSGGLGPTDGDLTRQALCELTGDTLVLDEPARDALAAMLARRGREVTERQLRQAHRPSRAACLPNAFGTAPGLHLPTPAADLFCLPGPPGELRPMFESSVLPRLRPQPGRTVLTRLAHIVGIAEADCVTRLGDLTRRDRIPLVGVTASGGILTLRIRSEGVVGHTDAARLLDETEVYARTLLGDHLFAVSPVNGVEALAATVIDLLTQRGETLATVESCTGGMLGEIITAIPGASSAYLGGFITYANDLKAALGVEPAAIAEYGAVSPAVALQLAKRGRDRSASHHALAISGIAGPGGGTPAKPVGTVHIALATLQQTTSRHFLFSGDRDDIRRRAAVSALAMLYFALREHPPGRPPLLWQVSSTPPSSP